MAAPIRDRGWNLKYKVGEGGVFNAGVLYQVYGAMLYSVAGFNECTFLHPTSNGRSASTEKRPEVE